MNIRSQIDPSHPRSTFKPTYHTMRIVQSTSWNGTVHYWNVDRNRWDNGDTVTPSLAHEATEADLRIARQHAEDEGALHLADSAMLVNFDELFSQ